MRLKHRFQSFGLSCQKDVERHRRYFSKHGISFPRRLILQGAQFVPVAAAYPAVAGPYQNEIVERNELHAALARILSILSWQEQLVVCSYYGLFWYERRSLHQIGKFLGVTRERARQIRNRTLRKIMVYSQRCPVLSERFFTEVDPRELDLPRVSIAATRPLKKRAKRKGRLILSPV
jgi:RNA polymerase sigma factor (sigma-70 family)